MTSSVHAAYPHSAQTFPGAADARQHIHSPSTSATRANPIGRAQLFDRRARRPLLELSTGRPSRT